MLPLVPAVILPLMAGKVLMIICSVAVGALYSDVPLALVRVTRRMSVGLSVKLPTDQVVPAAVTVPRYSSPWGLGLVPQADVCL